MKQSMTLRTISMIAVIIVLVSMLWADPISQAQLPAQELVLATTTSTADSGLLNFLNPLFESTFNAQVKVLSLGTGAALRIGENGDADVVMVHARSSEDAFLQAGFGINRRDVMFNDFVIVGPIDDPADIRGSTTAAEAFANIAASQSRFISRGDESGTNKKELAIWELANVDAIGDWYLKVGRGMGDTLLQTNEFGGYTLSDRGTFLALGERLPNLTVLVEGPVKGGDPILLNPYGIIAVNPARFPARNYALAMAYIGFLTSPEAQQMIANYRINDEPLFFPNALNQEANFQQYIPLNQD
jgi:tungstate transport system substrate-binding protein